MKLLRTWREARVFETAMLDELDSFSASIQEQASSSSESGVHVNPQYIRKRALVGENDDRESKVLGPHFFFLFVSSKPSLCIS